MLQQHGSKVGEGKFSAAIEATSQPVRRIPASACQLCDYENVSFANTMGDFTYRNGRYVSLEKFRAHLGHHLEQLALSVLPTGRLVQVPEDAYEEHEYEPYSFANSRKTVDYKPPPRLKHTSFH